MEVEDKVEFAHVAEILVEHFDEQVDRLQAPELVVVDIHTQGKKEPSVSSANPSSFSARTRAHSVSLSFCPCFCVCVSYHHSAQFSDVPSRSRLGLGVGCRV